MPGAVYNCRVAAAVRSSVRFYAELNDFLPPARRAREIPCETDRTSVKDLIERFGVPHTEVDLVLVNGEPVDFGYLVRDGDRVSVYPVFESIDIAGVSKVRPEPLRELTFVVDCHLGKLARYLRMLGFDTRYENDWDDEELARISAVEGRVLLTRDRGLLKRSGVERGYCVRSDDLEAQLAELMRRFDLARIVQPFRRCPRCNGLLGQVDKAAILHRLEPLTREHYDEFRECADCGQIYWQGTHYEQLAALLGRVMEEDGGL